MHRILGVFGIAFLFALPRIASTEAVTFSSGDQPVALIELFTSEGCSSCPPADRYLSTLRDDPRLWNDYVPLAFHVDYWDYIGWRDRFANADYSWRQRNYAQEGGVRVVYTPGFFADGKEWRQWRGNGPPTSKLENHGILDVDVSQHTAKIRWRNADLSLKPQIHLALLGMGLETDVGAGENRGRKLQHDFVVLDVRSTALAQVGDQFEVTTTLPTSDESSAAQALAVWVSDGETQRPLQATGGYLKSF